MSHQPEAFLLFGEGGLTVEPDIVRAAGFMEPIDVLNSEYDAVFDDSGRRYEVSVVDGATQLSPPEEVDLHELRQRLREHLLASRLRVDPDDLLDVAREVLRLKWDHRWPRWPKWLDRRLHWSQPQILG